MYPLFRFPGTWWSTELEGRRFRVEVLPWRYDLDVVVEPGAPSEKRSILIKANETVNLTITGPESREPWGEPTNIEKQVPDRKSVAMTDVRIGYHPRTAPVVANSLEFTVRYEMTEIGDSARVTVTAEGRNTAASAVETCGCLSFWRTFFALGPEQLQFVPMGYVKDWYQGPKLDVAPVECSTRRLDCDQATLSPGEAISRSMTFSFQPADFAEKTGELHIRTYYFTGPPGIEWHDAERVDLGTHAVPLRIVGTTGF